jgi:hypothetical protein
MLKVLDPSELPLENTSAAPNLAPESKRERVEQELNADPTRSDREIGRICGVSHHTVGRRRAELGLVGNFGGPENCPPLQDCPADSPLGKTEAENSPIDRDETRDASNDDDPDPHTLAGQQQIEMYFNKEGGLVLKQHNWPDEDSFVIVAEPYINLFLDKLTDVCGVPSTKDLFRR